MNEQDQGRIAALEAFASQRAIEQDRTTNQAEHERLAHLDELEAEHERLRLLALLHHLTQGPDLAELKRLLGAQSSPFRRRRSIAGLVAKRAVTTIAVQAAAGLLAELLVPSLGAVAGKLIGNIADAIT